MIVKDLDTGKTYALQELMPRKRMNPAGVTRVYRRAADRPHPELSGQAEKNRTKKQVNLRVAPELFEQIEAKIEQLFVDRTAFMTAAIEYALANGQDFDDFILNESAEPQSDM